MQFTMSFLDIDCSWSNPHIAIAIAINALLFCVVMVRVLRSRRSTSAKVLLFGGVFLGAFIGSELAQATVLWAMSTAHSDGGNVTSVGCINSAPAIVGPAAAALGAITFWCIRRWMRPVPAV